MVRLAYALVGNGADAEDLVQDSFVEVYGHLDDVERPGAYLHTTVVNRCRSALRHRYMAADRVPDPPDGLSTEADEFRDVLAKLPEEQRVAIVLKYYGRFRASEIARPARRAGINGALPHPPRPRHPQEGAGAVSRIVRRTRRDLREIASLAPISPDARSSILARVGAPVARDDEEVVMLEKIHLHLPTPTPGRSRSPWRATVALGVAGIVLINNRSDETIDVTPRRFDRTERRPDGRRGLADTAGPSRGISIPRLAEQGLSGLVLESSTDVTDVYEFGDARSARLAGVRSGSSSRARPMLGWCCTNRSPTRQCRASASSSTLGRGTRRGRCVVSTLPCRRWCGCVSPICPRPRSPTWPST